MKKILTICLFSVLFSSLTFAQAKEEVTEEKRFRHEFGIDVSSILGGILIPTAFGFFNTENHRFPLSYRLYTPFGNLRAGAGLSSASEMYSTIYDSGLDTLEGNDLVLNTRIGIERMHDVSERWAFYYGIDYEYDKLDDFRETVSPSQGYEVAWIVKGERHGISPLLGFRLQFNDRIGLQTEVKLTYYMDRQNIKRNFTKIDNNNGNDLPDNQHTFTQISGFDFATPSFLILTIKI